MNYLPWITLAVYTEKKKQAAARPKTGNEKLKPNNIKSGHKACGKKDCG